MARRTIAELHAQLRVDGSRLRTDINKSTRLLQRQLQLQADAINRIFSRSLTIGLTSAFVAATGAVVGLTRAVNSSRQEIDNLAKDAERIGLATEQLQALRLAAEESGASASALTSALAKMQDSISDIAAGVTESQGLLQAFEDLNLQVSDLINLDPASQFIAVAEAIGRVRNEADRTRLTRDLFGRGGVAIAPLLRGDVGGRVEEARGFLGNVGATIRSFEAKEVEQMNDALARLGVAVGALINQLTVEIAPTITDLARQLTNEIGALNKKIPELSVFSSLGDTVQKFGDTMDEVADKLLVVGQTLDKLISLFSLFETALTLLGAGAFFKMGTSAVRVGSGINVARKEWKHLWDLEGKELRARADLTHPFDFGKRGEGFTAKELSNTLIDDTDDLIRWQKDLEKTVKADIKYPRMHKIRKDAMKQQISMRQEIIERLNKGDLSVAEALKGVNQSDEAIFRAIAQGATAERQLAGIALRTEIGKLGEPLFAAFQAYAVIQIKKFISEAEEQLKELREKLKGVHPESSEYEKLKAEMAALDRTINERIIQLIKETEEDIKRLMPPLEEHETQRFKDAQRMQETKSAFGKAIGNVTGNIIDNKLFGIGVGKLMEKLLPEDEIKAAQAQVQLEARDRIRELDGYMEQVQSFKARQQAKKDAPLILAQMQEDLKHAAVHLNFVGRAAMGMKNAFDRFKGVVEEVPYKEIETHIINLERTLKTQISDLEERLPRDSRAFHHPFENEIDELLEIRDTMKSINSETSKVDTLLMQFDAAGIRELGYQLENTADSLDPFTDRFKSLKRDLDAIRETPMGEILAEDINRITTLIEYTEAGVFQVFDALRNNVGTAIDQLIDTGEFKFRDFFAGVLKDMAKIYARLLLFGQSGAGGLLGSIAFSVFGSVFGAAVLGPAAGALDFGFGGEGTATAIPGGGYGQTTGEVTTVTNNPDLLPGFAEGGRFNTSSPFMVGEKGPEIVVPRSAGYVIPNDAVSKMNEKPAVNITQNIHAGVDQQQLAFAMEKAKQEMKQELLDDLTGAGPAYLAIEKITA